VLSFHARLGENRLTDFPEMKSEHTIDRSCRSFEILRWSAPIAAVLLPFTFAGGRIPLALIARAIPVGFALLFSILLRSRTGTRLWSGLCLTAYLLGSRLSGAFSADVSMPQFCHWFCFVIIFAGAPLICFRSWFLHFARLDDPWDRPTVKP